MKSAFSAVKKVGGEENKEQHDERPNFFSPQLHGLVLLAKQKQAAEDQSFAAAKLAANISNESMVPAAAASASAQEPSAAAAESPLPLFGTKRKLEVKEGRKLRATDIVHKDKKHRIDPKGLESKEDEESSEKEDDGRDSSYTEEEESGGEEEYSDVEGDEDYENTESDDESTETEGENTESDDESGSEEEDESQQINGEKRKIDLEHYSNMVSENKKIKADISTISTRLKDIFPDFKVNSLLALNLLEAEEASAAADSAAASLEESSSEASSPMPERADSASPAYSLFSEASSPVFDRSSSVSPLALPYSESSTPQPTSLYTPRIQEEQIEDSDHEDQADDSDVNIAALLSNRASGTAPGQGFRGSDDEDEYDILQANFERCGLYNNSDPMADVSVSGASANIQVNE